MVDNKLIATTVSSREVGLERRLETVTTSSHEAKRVFFTGIKCESALFLEPNINMRSVQHCASRRQEANTNTR